MNNTGTLNEHGTARLLPDDAISRSIRIFKPLAEVNRHLANSAIPGNPEATAAPGNRGTYVRVEIPKDQESSFEEALSCFKGESTSQQLESALRQFKARLETGEVATVEGQSSGRDDD